MFRDNANCRGDLSCRKKTHRSNSAFWSTLAKDLRNNRLFWNWIPGIFPKTCIYLTISQCTDHIKQNQERCIWQKTISKAIYKIFFSKKQKRKTKTRNVASKWYIKAIFLMQSHTFYLICMRTGTIFCVFVDPIFSQEHISLIMHNFFHTEID